MHLGLREGNIVNEIKILAVVSKILCPSALVNIIQALLKTRKGGIFQCLDSGLFTMNFSELRPCQLIHSE